MPRMVSNKTLVREVKTLLRRGNVMGLAVRQVFQKHRLHNPSRFGEICRLAQAGVQQTPPPPPTPAPAEESEKDLPWWKRGQYA